MTQTTEPDGMERAAPDVRRDYARRAAACYLSFCAEPAAAWQTRYGIRSRFLESSGGGLKWLTPGCAGLCPAHRCLA